MEATSGKFPAEASSEPQAEPSGGLPPRLSSFRDCLATGPSSKRKARRLRGGALPGSLGEIVAGREPSGPVPPHPVAVLGMTLSEPVRAQPHAKNVEWRDESAPVGPSSV